MDTTGRKQEKYEKYMDAAIEYFMECYDDVLTEDMQQEADRLREHPDKTPPHLEAQGLALIKKATARCRRSRAFKSIKKAAKKLAVFAMVLLSLSSILFMTVDAVRAPILQYYITKNVSDWDITDTPVPEAFSQPGLDFSDPLGDSVPEGFVLTKSEGPSFESMTAVYKDGNSRQITFLSGSIHDSTRINTHEALVEEIIVRNGTDVIHIVRENSITYAWYYEGSETLFILITEGVDAAATEKMLDHVMGMLFH